MSVHLIVGIYRDTVSSLGFDVFLSALTYARGAISGAIGRYLMPHLVRRAVLRAPPAASRIKAEAMAHIKIWRNRCAMRYFLSYCYFHFIILVTSDANDNIRDTLCQS